MQDAEENSVTDTPKDMLKPGRVVGEYIIGEAIATGGMGRIYRAWDNRLNRPVAIKILAGSQALDSEQVARFKRETSILAKLSHPAIVRVLDAGEFDGRPYFVMELVEGLNLEEHVVAHPSPASEVVSWMRQVATGVSHLHEEGLLHRDVKPSNILLRGDGNVTLVDFGLAHSIHDSETSLTQSGVSMGTPAFMAPEQAKGEREKIDERTDIYQLGATLFALLAGRPPQIADSPQKMMVKVAEAHGPQWGGVLIPKPLRAIISQAMAKNRLHRYQSVASFDADLERWQSGEWVVARRDPIGKWLNFFWRRLALPVLILALGAAMTIAVVMVEGRIEEPVYKPITLGHQADDKGMQRHAVGGEQVPGAPNRVFARDDQSERWLGFAAGGRLAWGDTSEDPSKRASAPTGQHPTPLGRGDFTASFNLGARGESSDFCFFGAPWHDPQAGSAFELDWREGRVRLHRRRHVLFDIRWPELISARNGATLRVERHARRVSVSGQVNGSGVESFSATYLDGPISLKRSNIQTEDAQLGVVTKSRALIVNEITYQQHVESPSFVDNLYALGAYEDALEIIDARLGVLGGGEISANERRHLHFIRGECLRFSGDPRLEEEALDEYKEVLDGDSLESFYAHMAILETQLARDKRIEASGGPLSEIPESLDLRIRSLASGDEVRTSIYSMRLAHLAEQALPQPIAQNPESKLGNFELAFELMLSAAATSYADPELQLSIHRGFMQRLYEGNAGADTPQSGSLGAPQESFYLWPDFLPALERYFVLLAKSPTLPRWGDDGLPLMRYLERVHSLDQEFVRATEEIRGVYPLPVAGESPEWAAKRLHADAYWRRAYFELSQGRLPPRDVPIAEIAEATNIGFPDVQPFPYQKLLDLFSEDQDIALKAEFDFSQRIEKHKADLQGYASYGYASFQDWRVLMDTIRYRHGNQELYAKALKLWFDANQSGLSDSWISRFLNSEYQRLSK